MSVKKSLILVAIGLLSFSWGCAANGPVSIPFNGTRMELQPADISIVGLTEGKDCVPIILGLQFSIPSYADAKKNALQSKGGELLLNEVHYLGAEHGVSINIPSLNLSHAIYADKCFYVEGMAAKLK